MVSYNSKNNLDRIKINYEYSMYKFLLIKFMKHCIFYRNIWVSYKWHRNRHRNDTLKVSHRKGYYTEFGLDTISCKN